MNSFTNKTNRNTVIIALIYLIAIVYMVAQGLFYNEKIPNSSPDEMAHISYTYYIRNTHELIPHFEDMVIFDPEPIEGTENQFAHNKNLVNYLCHPPVYYHIMSLVGGFNDLEKWDLVEIDRDRLRFFSLIISVIGTGLLLYIGWSRITKDNPWLHLIYAICVTSVPIYCFEMFGVSNDALALVTTAICAIGLIRFCENNRNLLTYLLVVGGITLSLLNKMTSGMLCVIMALIVLLFTIIKEHSIKNSLKKEFWIVTPLLILPLIYIIVIYNRYGVLQPTVKNIASPEYFKTTFFYVAEENRIPAGKKLYTEFFLYNFFLSWSGLVTQHSFLTKSSPFTIATLPLELMWIAPLFAIGRRFREMAKKVTLPIVAGFISAWSTVLLQLKKGWGNFITNGYTGGTQARYYVPMVFIFALSIVFIFASLISSKHKFVKYLGYGVGTAYAGLIIYGNFIYYYLLIN